MKQVWIWQPLLALVALSTLSLLSISSGHAQVIERPDIKVNFAGSSLLDQLRTAINENRSYNEFEVDKTTKQLALIYSHWNPKFNYPEALETLKSGLREHGIDKGLMEPAILLMDVSLFHNRSDFAASISAVLTRLNPKVGDILDKNISFEKFSPTQDRFPTQFPRFISPNSDFDDNNAQLLNQYSSLRFGNRRKLPTMNEILFGPGSFDAEEGPLKSAANPYDPTPLLGRHINEDGDAGYSPNRVKRPRTKEDVRQAKVIRCYAGCFVKGIKEGAGTVALIPSKLPAWVKVLGFAGDSLTSGTDCSSSCGNLMDGKSNPNQTPATQPATSELPDNATQPEQKKTGASEPSDPKKGEEGDADDSVCEKTRECDDNKTKVPNKSQDDESITIRDDAQDRQATYSNRPIRNPKNEPRPSGFDRDTGNVGLTKEEAKEYLDWKRSRVILYPPSGDQVVEQVWK